MRYAPIYLKNNITGREEYKGEAMLLNKMDERNHQEQSQSFWEVKFINNPFETHCFWVENNKIRNKEKL